MSTPTIKRLKWALLIAVPVLLGLAMVPGLRARREYAATQKLLLECQSKARVPEIKRLIAQGADVNGRCLQNCPPQIDRGVTAMHLCIRSSAPDVLAVIKTLLDAGADIDSRDNIVGTTPLMTASNFPSPEIVQLLIAKGADVNLRTEPMKFPDSPQPRSMSALDFVKRTSSPKFQRGYSDIMPLSKLKRIQQMLVEAGAQE